MTPKPKADPCCHTRPTAGQQHSRRGCEQQHAAPPAEPQTLIKDTPEPAAHTVRFNDSVAGRAHVSTWPGNSTPLPGCGLGAIASTRQMFWVLVRREPDARRRDKLRAQFHKAQRAPGRPRGRTAGHGGRCRAPLRPTAPRGIGRSGSPDAAPDSPKHRPHRAALQRRPPAPSARRKHLLRGSRDRAQSRPSIAPQTAPGEGRPRPGPGAAPNPAPPPPAASLAPPARPCRAAAGSGTPRYLHRRRGTRRWPSPAAPRRRPRPPSPPWRRASGRKRGTALRGARGRARGAAGRGRRGEPRAARGHPRRGGAGPERPAAVRAAPLRAQRSPAAAAAALLPGRLPPAEAGAGPRRMAGRRGGAGGRGGRGGTGRAGLGRAPSATAAPGSAGERRGEGGRGRGRAPATSRRPRVALKRATAAPGDRPAGPGRRSPVWGPALPGPAAGFGAVMPRHNAQNGRALSALPRPRRGDRSNSAGPRGAEGALGGH